MRRGGWGARVCYSGSARNGAAPLVGLKLFSYLIPERRVSVMAINLGRPAGPQLRELPLAHRKRVRVLLDAWLDCAIQYPPEKREPLPVGYTRALASLAKQRGIRVVFDGREGSKPLQVTLGRTIPGCVGGTHRKVVARKAWT